MKKTIDQRLDEMLEQAGNGTLNLVPCEHYSTNRNAAELKKAVDELKRLNGISVQGDKTPRSEVDIRVSKSTYTRLSKKAKRANMDVAGLLEKLAGEK